MSTWIATIPRTETTKRKLRLFFKSQDIKKWVYGRETGEGGFEHIQLRFEWLDKDDGDAFPIWKDWFYSAHLEVARTDSWEYEKKSGRYFCWNDTPGKIAQRYGPYRECQREVLRILNNTNDRQIVLWYDGTGNHGKSWMAGSLWERRLGYYCPPYLNGVKEIVQYVASGYDEEPYIIIDLPRAMKWDSSLYAGIEAIKDGLIAESRYHAQTRNIRGVKVLVMSNTRPKLDKLSSDRWVIYEPS